MCVTSLENQYFPFAGPSAVGNILIGNIARRLTIRAFILAPKKVLVHDAVANKNRSLFLSMTIVEAVRVEKKSKKSV